VFERFTRGDPRGAGAGLGLSIVRQIMERNGGAAVALGSRRLFRTRLSAPGPP